MITSPQMSEVPQHTSRPSPTVFRWAGYWNAATQPLAQPLVGTTGHTTTRLRPHWRAGHPPAGRTHWRARLPLANGPLAAGRRYLGTSPYNHSAASKQLIRAQA